MSAKPILVANWKNFPSSPEEAKILLRELAKKKLLFKRTALLIAPPLPYLGLVVEKASSYSSLASQDFFPHQKGKFTGSVTSEILKSFGVKAVIIGHSERRALGETSDMVAQKAKAALKAGLTPIICFGEKETDSEGGHFEELQRELKVSIAPLSKKEISQIILAYEPVWAIGKSAKEAIDPTELYQTIIFIRKILTDLFGRGAAESVSILYGGSVEPENAGALMKNSGIRGFLVGHASLKPQALGEIASSFFVK